MKTPLNTSSMGLPLFVLQITGQIVVEAFYHPFQGLMDRPSFLSYKGTKIGGNAFLGISLSRYDPDYGHPDTETLQTAFDLNEISDREYQHLISNNDDGWLVGGGEAGPYKLPAVDSSHITLMDLGTFDEALGGLSQESIILAIESGDILIPQIEVLPTEVRLNPNNPPELELLFNLEPTFPTKSVPLPINWQLRFIANQLVEYFEFPNQVVPERYHCSVTRKVSFRSLSHSNQYFNKCKRVIQNWRKNGPQPLVGYDTWKYYFYGNYIYGDDNIADDAENADDDDENSNSHDNQYASGIWIYSNRQNRTAYIKPNFLPPYDSDPQKMAIIHDMLKVRYDPYFHVFFGPKLVIGCAFVGIALLYIVSKMMSIQRRRHSVDDKDNNQKGDDSSPDDWSAGTSSFDASLPSMQLSPIKLTDCKIKMLSSPKETHFDYHAELGVVA